MEPSAMPRSSSVARPHNTSKSAPGCWQHMLPLSNLERQTAEDDADLDERSESEYESMLEAGMVFGQWPEARGSLSRPIWALPQSQGRKVSIISIGTTSMDGRRSSIPSHRRSTRKSVAGSRQDSLPPSANGSRSKNSVLSIDIVPVSTRRSSAMSGVSAASSKIDREEEERMRRFHLMNFDLDRRFSEIVQIDPEFESDSESDEEMPMHPAPSNTLAVVSLWSPETANDSQAEDDSEVQSLLPVPTPDLVPPTGLAIYFNFPLDPIALQHPVTVEQPVVDMRYWSSSSSSRADIAPAIPDHAPNTRMVLRTTPSPPILPSTSMSRKQEDLLRRPRKLTKKRPTLSRAVTSPLFAFQVSPDLKQEEFPLWGSSYAKNARVSTSMRSPLRGEYRRLSIAFSLHDDELEESTLRKASMLGAGPVYGNIASNTGGRSRVESFAPVLAESKFLASQITTPAYPACKVSTNSSVPFVSNTRKNDTETSYFTIAPSRNIQHIHQRTDRISDSLLSLPPVGAQEAKEQDTLPHFPGREKRSASPVRPTTRRRPISLEAFAETIQSPHLHAAVPGTKYDDKQKYLPPSSQKNVVFPVAPVRRGPLQRATTDPMFVGRFRQMEDDSPPLAVSYQTSPKSPCMALPGFHHWEPLITPNEAVPLQLLSKRTSAEGTQACQRHHPRRCKRCAEKRALHGLEKYQGEQQDGAPRTTTCQQVSPSRQDARNYSPDTHHQTSVSPSLAPRTIDRHQSPGVRPRYKQRDTTLVDNPIAQRGGPLRTLYRPPPIPLLMLPQEARTSPKVLPPKAIRFSTTISPDLVGRQEHRRRQAKLAQGDIETARMRATNQFEPGSEGQATSTSHTLHAGAYRPTMMFSDSYSMRDSLVGAASPLPETGMTTANARGHRPAFVRHAYSTSPINTIRCTSSISPLESR
ncbi:hypothetical protein QFC19_002527 [Naganishia cerealis]|uniref:Uncharacterized protein n=1 Tax=Naganishia cerealis TaxID=610337 RepID=A0ACC2W946_9TREE|nr:hypothetical protein QFC19_002527 [Naganishia cerealis]